MTNTALKEQIDSNIANKTGAGSITKTNVGSELKAIIDYVDQQAPIKTAGSIDLSLTPQVLPYDMNSCSFAGGIAYLPATDVIGREIYAIAVANNIVIRANIANTNKMFTAFGTFTQNVVLATNQMCRFIYVGFETEGYWKAELI